MTPDTKILQIVTEQWVGNDGKTRTDILGLGSDSMMYKWFKGNGTWILNVLSK